MTSIGSYVFYGCSGLTSITIGDSVTSIGSKAFYNCSGLKSIIIPNSVTSIGNSAFYGCSGLTSIIIPNSVTSIGNYTFQGCTGLTSITIPNSVTSIGNYTFQGCTGLTNITIPNSVNSIGISAFEDCSSLTSIVIGNGINTIKGNAFAQCPELTDLYCYAETVPSTSTNAFDDSYIDYATLHVPESAIERYKASAPWNNYKDIVSSVDNSRIHELTIIVNNSFGKITYETTEVTIGQHVFNVSEGSDVVMTIMPFENCCISSLTVNGTDKTADIIDGKLTIKCVLSNIEVNALFVKYQELDVTHYLQNLGFDEDLTWKVDGSTKDIIDMNVSLSERSFAWQSADNSVYASAKTSDNSNWKRTDVDYSWNGFIGHVKGWELESNKMTEPPYDTKDKTPEWVFFGTVPYGLGPTTIPIADDTNGSFLTVPEKPANDADDNNKGALFLRAGWGSYAIYKQSARLPAGDYRLEYWIYNGNYEKSKNNANVKNLCKVICNENVFADEDDFMVQSWTMHTIDFTSSTSEFTIQFGYESVGSSISNPFLFIDGIKLYRIIETDSDNPQIESLLNITVDTNGTVTYNEQSIIGSTKVYSVTNGSDITLTVTPNFGYKVALLTVNGEDKTADVVDGQLTISNVTSNITVNVCFAIDGETAKVTIGENGIATFCPTGDVDFTTVSGIKAYIASIFNRQTGELTLTRVNDVPASTGLLLKGDPGTYQVPWQQSFSIVSNLLKGVTEATNVGATEGGYVNYVLSNGSQGVGFYKVGAAGASLEAGHAYLQIPAEAATSRSSLRLRFDDEEEATSISNVEYQDTESTVYDLQGRRVEQPQPGLYIRNGKKVIIK